MNKNGKTSIKKIKNLLEKRSNPKLFYDLCMKLSDDHELKYLVEVFMILIDKNKEIDAKNIWLETKNKSLVIQYMESCI